ncbi:MAG: hypothetical protein HRT90_09280 [Candidatus Margulisbacteria bacterium]|nr:hypothetical protein [Candidatus Margulisiibacteriota bacterium]
MISSIVQLFYILTYFDDKKIHIESKETTRVFSLTQKNGTLKSDEEVRLSKTKLLVIDDDDFIELIFKKQLLPLENHLEVSFETKLSDELSKYTPSLIFCDLNISGYRNEETLENVRSFFPLTDIVVMSGIEPSNLADLQSQFSFEEFLNKDDILSSLVPFVKNKFNIV